jgi:hypothetical protein
MTNHLQTSPAQGDGCAMETTPRAVEVPLFSRAHDLAGVDMSSSLLSGPFAPEQSILSPFGTQLPGGSNQLEQWYTRNDGPWIPKDVAYPGGRNGVNHRNHGFIFPGTYRESISPSECDTIPPGLMPSDSGYGSHGAKQSNATASICYEDALDQQETQSLAGHFSFGLDTRQWRQSQTPTQPPSLQRHNQTNVKELVCKTCNKTLKTNSELK